MNTPTIEQTAKQNIENDQLRRNIGFATKTIREKRKTVVQEMPDWEELREAGQQIKDRVVKNLDSYLLQLEESVQDRKSTRLNSSHVAISYAVFCLKKK